MGSPQTLILLCSLSFAADVYVGQAGGENDLGAMGLGSPTGAPQALGL